MLNTAVSKAIFESVVICRRLTSTSTKRCIVRGKKNSLRQKTKPDHWLKGRIISRTILLVHSTSLTLRSYWWNGHYRRRIEILKTLITRSIKALRVYLYSCLTDEMIQRIEKRRSTSTCITWAAGPTARISARAFR